MYKADIGIDGEWSIEVETPKAGGPYDIVLSDGEECFLHNVLIGEVWLCSGQSNMEMPLAGWGKVMNYEKEIAEADYPYIRLFQVKKETSLTPRKNLASTMGGWKECSPTMIPNFSAVGYFFARELYQKLNIPIGFINSSWGGTDIETWISMEVMDHFPKYEKSLSRMRSPEFEEYIKRSDKVKTEFEQAILNEPGETEKWYSEDTSTENWKKHAVPSLWSNEELLP